MVKDNTVKEPKKKITFQKKNVNKSFKNKPKGDKKQKKKPLVVNPLKQAYTNISRSLTNPELLKQRISEFLTLVQKDFLGALGKLLGSKGLQLVVKYGTQAQRKQVMLLMMSLDIEKVLKGKYSYFFLKKLLSRAKSDKIKTLFLNFFKNNFKKLFKSKHTFKFLNLYITNVPHSKRLEIAQENLSSSFFDEFSFKEFIDELTQKPRLLELELSQLYILSYFDKIPPASIIPLLNILLTQLDFMMKFDNLIVILLLNRFFSAVDFKNKKEIMKKCLKEKFWDFYSQNKFFIGFITHFMSEINDDKVIKVTLCKRAVERFVDFLSTVSFSKFLFLLFSEKKEVVFMKEKSLFSPKVRQILNIQSLATNSIFQKNCEVVRNSILTSSEFASTMSFEFVKIKTSQNHQFGLLIGHMIGHLIRLDSSVNKIKNFFELLTESLKDNKDLSQALIISPAGHRLVKRLIQNMSQAHSDVVSECQSIFETFVEQCKTRFLDLVNSRAVFVLVSLVENEQFGEEMKEFVRQRKSVLEEMEQTGGVKLLLQVIE
jgi:hypothetical protein